MALDGFTPDALIERLGWRPPYILNSMISTDQFIPFTAPSKNRAQTSSSLQILDTLPVELLGMICGSLDFRSLLRFMRVCRQAKRMVDSLPSYQLVMKHASSALMALCLTELIAFPALATIHTALVSDRCVSCRKYAAFLFLPTCERCCYECLHKKPSLRVIRRSMAAFYFGLSAEDLGRLPTMVSIPGRYAVGHVVWHEDSFRLVSLKQAYALCLAIHVPQKTTEGAGVPRDAPPALQVQHAQLHQPRFTQWVLGLESASRPDDRFCGMASMPFPSLQPNGELENGLWCGGCRINSDNYNLTPAPDNYSQHLLPWQLELLEAEYQARSRSEFLEHVRDCKGASDLLQEPARLLPWVTSVDGMGNRER